MIILHLPQELAAELGAPRRAMLPVGDTVGDVVIAADDLYPGLLGRLTEADGALRPHLNAFVGDRMVRGQDALKEPVQDRDEVWILRAISGG